MHLTYRNVNEVFKGLVALFSEESRLIVKQPSRNGNVLRINEPVLLTYERPTERVLFNSARDANPFMHVYEALWMLAGRNDVAPLAYYTSKMAQYSDDGKTFNGAYGYRWRGTSRLDAYGRGRTDNSSPDQLDLLITHLKADPNSRRAVLAMWNVEDDLLKIGDKTHPAIKCPVCKAERFSYGMSLAPGKDDVYCAKCSGTGVQKKEWVEKLTSKDVCCNLNVMFSLRKGEQTFEKATRTTGAYPFPDPVETYLDMTVTNRSNDMILGMLGANYVHFTMLQEYMAARLGVQVGLYHHFTNNLHVYDWNFKPDEWLRYYGGDGEVEYVPACNIVPLVKDSAMFEKELPKFVQRNSGGESYSPCSWEEPFLDTVAQPMLTAFRARKEKWAGGTEMWTDRIQADDWRIACVEWIERRQGNADHKERTDALPTNHV